MSAGIRWQQGFTVETKNLEKLQRRLESLAEKQITDDMLVRELRIDTELPFTSITESFWEKLRAFEPFGFGNPEPVFATLAVTLDDFRLVGKDGKHLKLRVSSFDAIAFGMGDLYPKLKNGMNLDIAYTIDMNVWNGNKKLQLKIKRHSFYFVNHKKSPHCSGA